LATKKNSVKTHGNMNVKKQINLFESSTAGFIRTPLEQVTGKTTRRW